MSADFWCGVIVGFVAFIALLIAGTLLCAIFLIRGAELAEARVWTGDDDQFLRDLNQHNGTQ